MHSFPGEDCRCEEIHGEHSHEQREDKEDICDNCGTALEWTLDVDGVQRRVCPSCGD